MKRLMKRLMVVLVTLALIVGVSKPGVAQQAPPPPACEDVRDGYRFQAGRAEIEAAQCSATLRQRDGELRDAKAKLEAATKKPEPEKK